MEKAPEKDDRERRRREPGMSLTISISFLTGRAHLHPWQTHHSEGRIEWPPSQWRLLRALVSVAGRALTSLPYPDFIMDSGKKPKPTKKKRNPVWPPTDYRSLPDDWHGEEEDGLPLSRLAQLLHRLSETPALWLPKTSGGHTRQYFPIHEGGMVKNTGSAVFDTFASIRKDQPLIFHWPQLELDEPQRADLKQLLDRMTYFGRAESWCRAEAHDCGLEKLGIIPDRTHWECICIEDGARPNGKEYRDYLLERRLAPAKELRDEVADLLPRTKPSIGRNRSEDESATLKAILQTESSGILLLRCLARESGQDIRDGLERPIGTRWIHYAVPRTIYDVPFPKPQPPPRVSETVELVRYALNTATTHRPVLPPLTDTLLVADRFRSAAMALCHGRSRTLSGHEEDGSPCRDHQHAFWWPLDEDNDGFIDHLMVWAPGGFEQREIDALRRLTRLKQRGSRPDLLIAPTYVGRASGYAPWNDQFLTTFVSATPYFCPLHLSHGKTGIGRTRAITRVIREGLLCQGITEEVADISEIVFDYAPDELMVAKQAVAAGIAQEPIPHRQYFGVADSTSTYPPLPRPLEFPQERFRGGCLKDPDAGFPFGLSIGLTVDGGQRFIRALSFCRRRRNCQAKGYGRMFRIRFQAPRSSTPFALGDQCHFGFGLFVPIDKM